MKKVIATDKAPAAIGPYSQAIEIGNFVFTSGQIPVNPATGEIPEGVEAQAEQAIKNLEVVLKEAGCTLKNVVKTTVFLADINDFAKINAIYAKYFDEHKPARSCVQAGALPKGGLFEMEVIAVKE